MQKQVIVAELLDPEDTLDGYFTEESIKQRLPRHLHDNVTEHTIQAFNFAIGRCLGSDNFPTDIVEMYKKNLLDWFSAKKAIVSCTNQNYADAVKFVTLIETGMSKTDAYSRVFPERANKAKEGYVNQYAHAYSKNKLVQEIQNLAGIDDMLAIRVGNALGIKVLMDLATRSKNEAIKVKAASALITLDRKDNRTDSNKELNRESADSLLEHLKELANIQKQQLMKSEANLKNIGKVKEHD